MSATLELLRPIPLFTALTISRSELEMLLEFNRDLALKVLWAVVRMLSGRLRSTNDSLKSFLALSMF